MDSLLDRQEPDFILLSRYTTESSQTCPRTSRDTPTKQTSLPPSPASENLSKQASRCALGREDTTAESRVLVPRRGTSNIPAKIPRAVDTKPQKTVTVTLYAANHRPYEVPIKFYHQQTTKRSRHEQIFTGQMQGGPELLSWLDVVRPKLFTQIPSFVFPPGDSFLTPKETVNLIGGLTDQRDADTHRLSQLTAKFLREYFANMSMENRPLLYGQAQTDDQQLAFHKGLHDIFFSIQVHRRKQNKNIVGDPLKGPHPLVARAAKEKYIQGACFYIHPCVMKKVVQHVVEARRAFLLKKQGQGQCQAQPHVQPQTNRFGSIRMMKSCASLKANKMNNNNSSIRRMKSHASLKGTELTNMSSNNIIIPMVPIPTEDWGRRDPQAWLVGWDLEMESLAYMHRSSDFPRLGKMHERQLVYYQFARSVDEWMWRLEQAEKNVNYKQPEKNADCGQLKPKSPCEDTEELLIEL